MKPVLTPNLSAEEIKHCFSEAKKSKRRRFPKILHKHGDYHNRVINFALEGSYMQPHLHPGDEKIEKMVLIAGSFALLLFDNNGVVSESFVLKQGERETIEVPAYAWHTYVMLTEQVVIYETMDGVYDPYTWKEMAPWSPPESDPGAYVYLTGLKNSALSRAVTN